VKILKIKVYNSDLHPINQLNPATFVCACLTSGPVFPTSYMLWCFFVFSELRWEVIVYFVDIGGIVDHHWLNFLFITIFSLLVSNVMWIYRQYADIVGKYKIPLEIVVETGEHKWMLHFPTMHVYCVYTATSCNQTNLYTK
jgi:hypothetical protein